MSKSTDKIVKGLQEALNDADKKKTSAYDTTATVVRSEGNTLWVHIPGGIDETPVRRTVNADPGDEVHVRVSNGTAWALGNETNPAAGYTTVWPSVNYFNQLAGQDITVNAISAATGYIDDLYSKNVTTENLSATNGYIQHLVADDITANDISASSGYIKDLTAESITTDDIKAATGYIQDLTAEHITADDIIADHATIDDLDATYAEIDAANVTDLSAQNAWVNKILVQTGLIAHESNIFTLDAIQVNAANITAGTLDVNRLIVTVDGEKYLVNVDPSTGTPSYEKMDGDIVEPRTITADKIVAHDITVQEITTENLVGTNGWINLNQGKFFYTTNGSTWANTTNGIMWDGTSLKIKGDVNITAGNVYTKTESDTALSGKVGNNEVITKINASSEGVQISASKVNIQGVITAINNDSTTTINGNKITTGTLQASDIYIGADVLTNVINDMTDELGNIYQLNILTSYTSTGVVHTAQLLQNGVDISADYANDFEWNAKLTSGYEFIGNGRSITIQQSSLHYAHAVTVSWTRRQYEYLLNNAGNNLVTSTGAKLMGRTEY